MSVQEIVWHILDLTGMTQTELAKRSGIPQANISRFLKGNTTPKRNTLSKLAKGLSVTEDELTGAAPLRYDKDTKAVFPMPVFQNELEWAASDDCNVEQLRQFIFENPTMPLVAYGNGGNYSTAFYFASLYASYKGLARAMSCFECSTLSDEAIKHSKHIIITGSGTSMDAKYAVKRLIGLNAKNTGAISKLDYISDNGKENLVKKTIEKKNPQNNFDYNYQGHEQNKNFRGHSFIGLSSVVSKYAMIYKAFTGKTDFTCLNSTAERLEVCANDGVSVIPNLSVINRFVVLYGSWGECVAKDIECKLVESSLGSAVITDYRNFCHGKFTISSNFKDLAVVLLITPRERKLAQQIRNFRATPHDISIISIETEYDSPLAAIDLLIKSSAFIYQRAEAVGRHPLKTPPTPSEVDVRFPKNGVNYEQELKRIGSISLKGNNTDGVLKYLGRNRKGKILEPRVYSKSNCILFSSKSATETKILSNMHRCNLVVNGYTFNSSEHLFQSLVLNTLDEAQVELSRIRTPFDAKSIAKGYKSQMPNEKEEHNWYFNLMLFCLAVKYKQCEEFRTLIDSTEDKELVEYSTWWDSFWGACDTVSELNNNWSEGDIKGINLTGRAMMTMRQYRSVILNHPIAAPYDFVHECDFQICGRKIEPV